MLRKLIIPLVCLVVASCSSSTQITPTTPPDNEIWYTTTDGKSLGIKGESVTDTYNNGLGVIRFSTDELLVRYINSGNLSVSETLESISLPNSVTVIGDFAFEGCSSLSNITLPNSITNIGNGAFSGCSSLTSITIPSSVISIGDGAFSGCSSLTSTTIPNSVTSIGNGAFEGCTGTLTINCNIPNGKYTDNRNSDNYGSYLYPLSGSEFTKIVIGEGVTNIGNFAFMDCSNIRSITIPSSVTSIGYGAFGRCDSLDVYVNRKDLTAHITGDDINNNIQGNKHLLVDGKEITELVIPDSVTEIREEAFSGCSSLTNITIPSSVTSIGHGAFQGCSSLTSVTIGNSVTEIREDAFSGCRSLTSITIPDSVTTIETDVFNGCCSLKEFKGKFASADNRCLVIDGVLKAFAPKDLTEYTIPDSVTEIGNRAFAGCSGLTSITVPNSVTKIGDYAFDECTGELIIDSKIIETYTSIDYLSSTADWLKDARFTMLTIGDNITMIGQNAFQGCSSLTSVTIPDSVTEIKYNAFKGCRSLTSITIPDSVTEIAYKAFDECTSLTDTYVNIKDLAAYATSNDIHYIPGNKHLLVDGKEITELAIPDSVTKIGYKAFQGCSSLTSITIPDSVTEIEYNAFKGCSSLTSTTIPNSVTSIGNGAFEGCSGLKEFKGKFASADNRYLVINGVLKAFAPKDLTEYTIPDSVTEIGYKSFADCSSLTSVTIPDSVTEIGTEAFSHCNSLTSVTIGNGITLIREKAFSCCHSLTSIYCKATGVPSAYTNMFEHTSFELKIYVPRKSESSYEWYWHHYKYQIYGYDF